MMKVSVEHFAEFQFFKGSHKILKISDILNLKNLSYCNQKVKEVSQHVKVNQIHFKQQRKLIQVVSPSFVQLSVQFILRILIIIFFNILEIFFNLWEGFLLFVFTLVEKGLKIELKKSLIFLEILVQNKIFFGLGAKQLQISLHQLFLNILESLFLILPQFLQFFVGNQKVFTIWRKTLSIGAAFKKDSEVFLQ